MSIRHERSTCLLIARQDNEVLPVEEDEACEGHWHYRSNEGVRRNIDVVHYAYISTAMICPYCCHVCLITPCSMSTPSPDNEKPIVVPTCYWMN